MEQFYLGFGLGYLFAILFFLISWALIEINKRLDKGYHVRNNN